MTCNPALWNTPPGTQVKYCKWWWNITLQVKLFVSWKSSNDPLHPDYVPSLFRLTPTANSSCEQPGKISTIPRSFWLANTRELTATALLNLRQDQCIYLHQTQRYRLLKSTEIQTEETHNDIASLHAQIKSLNTECQLLRNKVHILESELKHHTLDN